jgi:SAM-dependent methyltransferase
MAADYHRYIYDLEQRRIVGDFDAAYRSCDDVWPTQHEVHLQKFRVVLERARRVAEQRGRPARVLDVGAGYGDFVASLLADGVDAFGVEVSAEAVRRGLERHGLGERLLVGDLRHGLPFADARFDVVVLYGVMWFLLDHLDASLAELHRVLRPDGWLAASAAIPDNPIGGHIMGSYDDFVRILQRRFVVQEACTMYDASALTAGASVAGSVLDFVAFCSPGPTPVPDER